VDEMKNDDLGWFVI